MKTPHRYINFRAFLLIFILTVFSISGCYLSVVYGAIGWLVLGITAVALIILCVLANSENWGKKATFTILICIAVFIIIVSGFNIRLRLWHSVSADGETKYNIEGKLDALYYDGDDPVITIKTLKVDGKRINGKMRVYIESVSANSVMPYVGAGDTLKFKSTLLGSDMIGGNRVNASNIRNNIRYKSYVSFLELTFMPGEADFFAALRIKISNILTVALGTEYGSLAAGMLTGDTSGMLSQTHSAFSTSGLGHLLSVSGLHIGYISVMLMFVFKKLKLKPGLSAVLSLMFFIFYMFLANFSAPVLRAVIMFETLTLSRLFAKRYDPLTSLCFASTFILLIQPFSLFDPSFVLSAGAMYGMMLFSDPIARFFKSIKIPAFITKPLALSLSVQIGILPAMMYFFKEIQIYSIFANMLLMPLISVTFIAVVAALMLNLIAPFFRILLTITGLGLALISDAASLTASLPNAILPINSSALIFLCYPLYFLFSGFYMKRMKISIVKIISVSMSVVLLLSGLFYFPPEGTKSYIIPLAAFNSVTSIVGVAGQTYIVGDFYEYYEAENAMLSIGTTKVKAIYINTLDKDTAYALVRFCAKFKVEKIYCPFNASLEGLDILLNADIGYFYLLEPDADTDGYFDTVSDAYGNHFAYELRAGGVNVLFCSGKANYTNIDPEILNRCGIIRTKIYLNEYSERIYLTSIPKGFLGEYPLFQYSTAELGTFVFDLESGKLMTTR